MILWIKKSFFKGAFLLYSYLYQVLFFLLDWLPHFIRDVVFKITFKKFGSNIIIDYGCYFRYFSNIEIGDNVSINKNCEFYTSANLGASIKIGRDVTISPNAKFYTIGHDPSQKSLPELAKDITLENNCWIGANSIVLPGVTVGEYSVVGAGSIVNKDIPPYSMAVGNPAKVIKRREID